MDTSVDASINAMNKAAADQMRLTQASTEISTKTTAATAVSQTIQGVNAAAAEAAKSAASDIRQSTSRS